MRRRQSSARIIRGHSTRFGMPALPRWQFVLDVVVAAAFAVVLAGLMAAKHQWSWLSVVGLYAHLWPTAEDKTREAASGMAAAVLATHLPRNAAH